MDVLCIDCGAVIPGAARQRRRCDPCRVERFRSYSKPIRTLRADEKPPEGQPSRFVNSAGYVRLRWQTPTEYVECYEHRFVMRAFSKDVEVHHIDGDRTNNDPTNLRVLTSEQHRLHHAKEGSGENSKTRFKRIDIDQAVALYKQGLGTERIAREIDANPSAVWRALKRAGVQIRPGKGGGPKRRADP